MSKNPYSENKEWLHTKYIVEGLSSEKIGKIIGVSSETILIWLKKNNIAIRDRLLSIKQRKGISKHEKLNDKDWLSKQYIENKLSTLKIAKLVNCSKSAVKSAIIKFGIKTRNASDYKEINKINKKFKFTELNDRQWLFQKYEIEKLNANKINDIIKGCNISAVYSALKYHGIKIRLSKDSLVNYSDPRMSKYEKLNDKEWLYQKYIIEELSMNDISSLLGISSRSSVRQFLLNHHIPVRDKSEGQLILRSDEYEKLIINENTIPVLEGCLLGDGFLSTCNKSKTHPFFSKRNIGEDHILYVANILFDGKYKNRVKDYPEYTSEIQGKIYNCKNYYVIKSYWEKDLIVFYERWYPEYNNYKKRVPRDISFTKDTLLHWFMDDGYSYCVNRKYKGTVRKTIRIFLCTQGFIKEDVIFLCCLLKEKMGIDASPRYHQRNGKIGGTGYEIEILERKENISRFYELIGPPPVPSLAYKWK